MTREPLRTVVVGFGQVADTLGEDSRMARYFGHASHAEVLAAHPAFAWDAVVDPSDEALQRARRKWGIQHTAKDFSGLDGYTPEIAVIAAPPAVRRDVIESFNSLRGVLVEKPLGTSISEAEAFVSTCRASELAVQVHFWRRAVPGFQELAKGRLADLIGEVQCGFGIYGRGLYNNASHLIDFVAMLLGAIEEVRAIGPARTAAGPGLSGDLDVAFALGLVGGGTVMAHPVDFHCYREVGLDLWGTTGRLSLLQESLGVYHYPTAGNRGLMDELEIASDRPTVLDMPVTDAYWAMYDNLANAVYDGEALVSPADSALRTMRVLDAVARSAKDGGRAIVPH